MRGRVNVPGPRVITYPLTGTPAAGNKDSGYPDSRQRVVESEASMEPRARRVVWIGESAYKLARIIYQMPKHGQEYAAQGQQEHEQAYQQRVLKNLKRKAKDLGYELTPREQDQLA